VKTSNEARADRWGTGRRSRTVAVLSAGALLASTVGAAATPVFDDVDHANSPHGEAISQLAEAGILLGKDDGRFDPAGQLTRAQFASVVARAAGLGTSTATPFSDVRGGPHAGAIAAASEAGFIQGFEDGTFRPNAAIKRDQMAALLYRWLEPPPADRAAFSDLGGTIHAAAINALADIGVVLGSTDRTFRPRNDVRRDQTASFVHRALQYLESLIPDGPNPWDEVGRDALRTTQPEGDVDGVTYHGTVVHPDHGAPSPTPGQTLDLDGGTSAVNPVRYEEGDSLVTTGSFGMRIYDIRDRFAPKLIGELDRTELALEGDVGSRSYHSAESLNIDKQRKLAFLSRDPRAFGNQQGLGTSPSGFYIIDIADPTAPELLHFQEVGAGHTSTCVNSCEAIWSGGPSRADTDPVDWIARPILVTDVSGVERAADGSVTGIDTVQTYEQPVDTGRYRGITDYSHDVQVDQQGVAWVSGRGGVRGYWTEGVHTDPTTGSTRTATAADPIPFAGGEVGDYNDPDDPRRLAGAIHNSERPVNGSYGDSAWTDSERPRRPDAGDGASPGGDHAPGELLYITDENFTAPCADSGKFYIASIDGSDQGQAWRSAEEVEEDGPYALNEVGRWSVSEKEGTTNPNSACSAHYFNMKDGIVAGGWYGQGFRFLDVTDPTDPIQIAYFRANGGSGWSTHWIDEVIYANDSALGLHILTLDGDAAAAAETRTEVLAPRQTAAQVAAQEALVADPVYGWSCALPARDPVSG
jgi:hypothetical protein